MLPVEHTSIGSASDRCGRRFSANLAPFYRRLYIILPPQLLSTRSLASGQNVDMKMSVSLLDYSNVYKEQGPPLQWLPVHLIASIVLC